MNRRQLLKAGIPLGAAAALGAHRLLIPPRPSRVLAPADELAARLVDGLDDEQRAAICHPYDHPLRQYHNRGVWSGAQRVWGAGLSRGTRQVLTDLFHAGLSERGRATVTNQFFVNWPGVHLLDLAVFGRPGSGPWQVVLCGPHLNLRLGGASPDQGELGAGAAFGGPQVWGEQRSDGVPGMPRNVHRDQFLAGQELIAALSGAARERARLESSPIQTDVEPRGPAGPFPGVPLGEQPALVLERARILLDSVLDLWPRAHADEARDCLERAGGLATLHLSHSAEGADRDWHPIFRLEGPSAVLHWRGWPHLHALCYVLRDGARPPSLSEPLGTNPALLEGPSVQRLFQRALRDQLDADLAVYPADSVAGHLRAGPIRTGDVHVLESWIDHAVLVELARADLVPELVARAPDQERVVVAAPAHVARHDAEASIGRRCSPPTQPAGGPRLVRDVLAAHLRSAGFRG